MRWIFSLFLFVSFSVNAASLYKMRGDVFVNGEKAKLNQSVVVGDIVEAKGRKSFAIIKFKIGSKTLITNGKVKIEKLKERELELNLIKGIISSHVEKAKKNKVIVKTKSAALGIRGTKFFTAYDEGEDDTYLCVCEGKVELENDTGKVLLEKLKDIHAKPGQKLEVREAPEDMLNMASELFGHMGIELKYL